MLVLPVFGQQPALPANGDLQPAADGKERPDGEEFDKAVRASAPAADKAIRAMFTGRFALKPPSKRILEIEGVSDLRISPQ
jgi:hypothetical protein